MTTPSKDDVLRIAGECGAITGFKHISDLCGDGLLFYPEDLGRFAAAMYAAGQESAKADGWRQCAVGQRSSQFCGMAEKARAAGAEDMRERAAVACMSERVYSDATQTDEDEAYNTALQHAFNAIRALPITPANTER